jgi:hypothetical protein
MDIATKFASSQEAVEAIFWKDKQPQGRQPEDVPEASAQRGTKKKGKKKSQAKRDAADADLVAAAEHRNPRKPPRGANLFDKMLKELCPYHQGPVKHTLEECVMLRRYFHKAGPPVEGGKGGQRFPRTSSPETYINPPSRPTTCPSPRRLRLCPRRPRLSPRHPRLPRVRHCASRKSGMGSRLIETGRPRTCNISTEESYPLTEPRLGDWRGAPSRSSCWVTERSSTTVAPQASSSDAYPSPKVRSCCRKYTRGLAVITQHLGPSFGTPSDKVSTGQPRWPTPLELYAPAKADAPTRSGLTNNTHHLAVCCVGSGPRRSLAEGTQALHAPAGRYRQILQVD